MAEREFIVREWRDEKGILHIKEVGQELVRCKECKHREKYMCRGIDDDFFCADGERESK